jgi:hypothetical protein
VQAIQVHEGPSGAAFVLVALDTGHAQLMLVGASKIDEAAWDEAVRFCWAAGWEPRQDDADVYVGAIDTEWYVLNEVDDEEVLDDEEVVEDGDATLA